MNQALLQKLKEIHTLSLVVRGVPVAIGGFYLHSLEITCGAQAIHHLVLSFTMYAHSTLLLIKAIEYHQLEIGAYGLFLSTLCTLLPELATYAWIAHLWEFLKLHRLEVFISALVLPSSSYSNDVTLIDLFPNSG